MAVTPIEADDGRLRQTRAWARAAIASLMGLVMLMLGVLTLGAMPVGAAVFVGVGVPAPAWVYYPPPPPYVVYPPYGYPGGLFVGFTFGPYGYRHWHHWHHWR